MNPEKFFFQNLIFYTLMIATAIIVGGVLPILFKWKQKRIPIVLSISAGLMLGAAFFHLIPESYENLGKGVGIYILLGFLFLFFIEKFVTIHVCEIFDCEVHHLGITAFIGIGFHTFINGIALGASLLETSPAVGLSVFLAIAAHKGPEVFSLSSLLLSSDAKKSIITIINLIVLLMIPVGALSSYYFLKSEGLLWMGRALAFSAGTFLHISLSDLLPEAHRHSDSRLKTSIAFILGLGVMGLLARYFLHHH